MLRVLRGDCLDVMRTFPAASFDTVVTDPPYGMGYQSNRSKTGPRHNKIIGDTETDGRFLHELPRILKPGGALLLFCNWKTSRRWWDLIEAAGFHVVSQVIWDRQHHGMGDLKGAFAPMHDIIWYATIGGRREFVHSRPKSVMSYKRPSPSEDFGHPTSKPVGLMEELIHAIDRGEGGVLDPFAGSGSTGVACVNLGLPFTGVEIDTRYADIAQQRIFDAQVNRFLTH